MAVVVAGLTFYIVAPEFSKVWRQATSRTPASSAVVAQMPSGTGVPAGASGHGGGLSICRNFHEAICVRQKGVTKDPTGIVKPDIEGELEALRIYEEIIRQHPDWDGEKVDEELVAQIYTPQWRQRVQGAFQWAQRTMIRLVQRESVTVLEPAVKKHLVHKLKKVILQLPPPSSVYADEPDLFTKNDVTYERLSNGQTRLRVGGAFLFTSKSWFNMVYTFAHELGHTIDPCEVRDFKQPIPAYDRLSSCFMAQHLVATPTGRMECTHNDQLSETFADWFAVRVIAEALRHYATEFTLPQISAAAVNSVRDLCEQEQSLDELDTGQHPTPEVRIDKIFGRSPEVRAVLGCELVAPASNEPYCTFEWRPSGL